MRAVLVLVALAASAACAPDHKPASNSGRWEAADCPIADEEFCAVATEVANALTTRDADTLLSLSRSETIVCAEMAVEYFPGCATEDVLEGFGVSGPDLLVQVVTAPDYLVHLRGTTTELSSQSVQILGVGTCGPDSPGQRTYHLSWTAEVTDVDGTSIPIVGSFEFNIVDDWRIALFYVGTLDSWQAEQSDPLHESFCEAGKNPWQS